MFFYVCFFIIILIEVILTSTIRIKINNLKLSTEKYMGRALDDKCKITISLWGLQNVRFFNLEVTKEKIEKLKLKEKIQTNLRKLDFEKVKKSSQNINIKTLKKVKKHMPKINYINLIASIGTEDALLTSFIVTAIAGFLGIVLRKQISTSKENRFIINPIYLKKNLLKLELDCIFETKVIHIIYIIYILNKKRRGDKNVRTSNRRSYGYSYE